MSFLSTDKFFILAFLGLLISFPLENSPGQQDTLWLDLEMVQLETINLGDLIVAAEIQNTTVYITVRIYNETDRPRDIQLRGSARVQLPLEGYDSPREVGWFLTRRGYIVIPPRSVRTILNTDFPDVVDIEGSEGDTDVLEDLRSIGRPAGRFEFRMQIIDAESGRMLDEETVIRDITNPAQILRTAPADGSQQMEENVVFTWTGDAGFGEYFLDVNLQEGGQTPEVALDSNQPPIFSGSVENATAVNLRDLPLERQVLPGMRIVWRVRGLVPGVGAGSEIPTDIGWFSITNPNSALITATLNELILLSQQLGLGDFASALQSGEITLTGEFQFADGTIVTFEELQAIMNYLKANPDQIIDVRIE